MTFPDPFTAGTQALERGAWEEARAHFQASVAARETPQALEQLGLMTWWLDDPALTFDARERAFRLYRDQDDPLGAARVALWLAWDSLAFRGDAAVAAGWLERAPASARPTWSTACAASTRPARPPRQGR